ncbi:MAG: hypothetical protein K2O84_05980, partial [Oscillospiraceae bacterium]|nr:hypothetical protein [Oscillospiraceae bacterium]
LACQQRGVSPIIKNVRVVDEQGKCYESTYPKRAKGLVKKGRARFISENTICLAGLPSHHLEVTQMTEQHTDLAVEYSIPYILRQVAAIQADTAYLREVLSKLAEMSDGDSGDSGSPGNVQGQAKAEAFGVIVKSRETTNQQILRLYEKMYMELSKAE